MPQRLTRHRGLQQQLTAGRPYTGPSTKGGGCAKTNGQFIINSDNIYPGITIILPEYSQFYPGKARIILELRQVLSWKIKNYPGIRARFILEYQELSRIYTKFFPGISRFIPELKQ